MVKVKNKRPLDLNSFHEDDLHALVSPSRFPPLNNSHEFVDYGTGKKHKNQGEVLKQVMVLHMESCVHAAQRSATLPGPQELANLPLFQQARESDIAHLKATHARRKELQRQEERQRLEEQRLEAERKLERQREREEQRKKRMEAKELRRQERMEAKRERMAAVQERKMRAYEEAYEKWERNFKEQKSSLDEIQEKIKMLSSMKLEREGSLRTFDTEKEELLESLRSAAVRADSLPPGAAKEKAEKEAKEKAEKEAKEKERAEREKKRERERERERGEYKYTSRAVDIQIVAKPQSERDARPLSEARSPSFRDRDRDTFGGGARKSIGIRDGGGYRYKGVSSTAYGDSSASPFLRGASIRDSIRPHDREPRDGRDGRDARGIRPRDSPAGHSIRRGPPMSAYGGGSIRDTRDPARDGPGSFSRYGPSPRGRGINRGHSRGR